MTSLGENPWELLARIARAEVGQREESQNDGARIRVYWRACGFDGYLDRLPWCAAFVAWCVKRAAEADLRCQLSNPPRFAGVLSWVDWCESNASRVSVANAMPGDIVIFLPSFSHIGIVVGRSTGLTLQTVEGNTNDSGGREGDGVYRRERCPIYPGGGSIWRLPCRALPVGSSRT